MDEGQKQKDNEDSPGDSQGDRMRTMSTECEPLVQVLQLINSLGESFSSMMYSFAIAAITNYHKLGGLNDRPLFSHSSGG